MVLFWPLLLAHLIADFSLQTNAIFRLKKQSPVGVYLHVAIYTVVNIAILFPYLGSVNTWLGVVFLAAFHGTVDSGKLKLSEKLSRDILIYFLFDQLLHVVSIAFASFVLIRQANFTYPFFVNPKYMVFLSGLWVSVFAGTAFIHYIVQDVQSWVKKDKTFTMDYPDLKEKLIGYCERLFATLFIVLGGFFLFFSVFVFVPRLIFRLKQQQVEIAVIETVAGILVCLFGGFIAAL